MACTLDSQHFGPSHPGIFGISLNGNDVQVTYAIRRDFFLPPLQLTLDVLKGPARHADKLVGPRLLQRFAHRVYENANSPNHSPND